MLFRSFLSACDSSPAPSEETVVSDGPATQAEMDPITMAEEAITETAYRRHIEILASDEFGGRAPASPGEELTVAYLLEAFEGLGLEPANGDSYIQEVPLTWVNAVNNPVLHFRGGAGEDMALAYPQDHVIWTRQQVAEASIKDSEMVFVGYGIVAPERN